MSKKFIFIFVLAVIGFGFPKGVHAASVDDYLVDGKLVVNSIQPTTWQEAYDYVGSYLMSHEEVDLGMIGGEETCNADFSVCEVVINFLDSSNSTMTVDIVYQPTNSTVKSKIDGFIASMGLFPEIPLNDLEIVNYIAFGTSTVSSDSAMKMMMANYSGELKKKLQNSNIIVDFTTPTALGSSSDLHFGLGGDAVLRFNDIGYGYLSSAILIHKNIIYVPTGTTEDKLLEVAQERINDYLGNSTVVLAEGGDLSSLIANPTDLAELIEYLGVSDVSKYFTLTHGDTEYNLLIVADSTKMVTPSLKTLDLITNAQITTSLSEIPLDSKIDANVLTSGNEYDEIVRTLKNDDVEMYDLKLYSKSLGSNITELSNGTFEVKIPVPSNLEGKDLVVYYVTSEGKVEEHAVTISNGYAVFTTDHFSIYTLSEKTANPDTYDGIITWIILGAVSLVGLTGTVIYRKRLEQENN